MITLYVNKKGEIKDVNTTSDSSLIALEVSDSDAMLVGRSVEEICCYKVKVEDGKITSFIPYVDTAIINRIRNLANKNQQLEEQGKMLTSAVDSILTDIIPSLFE